MPTEAFPAYEILSNKTDLQVYELKKHSNKLSDVGHTVPAF